MNKGEKTRFDGKNCEQRRKTRTELLGRIVNVGENTRTRIGKMYKFHLHNKLFQKLPNGARNGWKTKMRARPQLNGNIDI